MESFPTEAAVLNVFPAIFFWKFAEVLGQHHFVVLLIYCVLNAFILLYSTKDMLFGGDLQKIVFFAKSIISVLKKV